MSKIEEEIVELLDHGDGTPISLTDYKKAIELCGEDESLKDIIRGYKICHALGWVGCYNYNPYYMVILLKLLNANYDNEKRNNILKSYGFKEVPTYRKYISMYDINEFIDIPSEFVMTICAVLCDRDFVEYGTSLGVCWITDEGKELLNVEYSEFYKQILKDNNEDFWVDEDE